MNITIHPRIGDYYIAGIEDDIVSYSKADPYGEHWFPDIDQWCYDSFGEQDLWGEEPVSGWKRLRDAYYFTDESMLTAFMLRWK